MTNHFKPSFKHDLKLASLTRFMSSQFFQVIEQMPVKNNGFMRSTIDNTTKLAWEKFTRLKNCLNN